MIDAIDEPEPPKKCKPCFPSEGALKWRRIDTTGGSHFNRQPPPGLRIPVPHIHVSRMNQTPYPECKCHWNQVNDVVPGIDTTGMWGPNTPATGGGS